MEAAEDRLINSINELLDGIHLIENNLRIPALILLYAGMDLVASLDRSDPNAEATRADFLGWVEKYLLPNSQLKCNSIDLYSARCGWIHTYTSKSRLSRSKKAKEIFYQFGSYDNEDELQKAIKNPAAAVFVHFTKLFNAFRQGLDMWKRDFDCCPDHKERIMRNAGSLLQRIDRTR